MPQRILISWLGSTDLIKAAEGRGAIQDVLTVASEDGRPFSKVVVLDDGALNKQPADDQCRAVLKQRLQASGAAVDWRDMSGLQRMDIDSLTAGVCDVLDGVCVGLDRHDSVELGLSSGMWTMASSLLLARTRFARPFPLWAGRMANSARESAERLPAPQGASWTPIGRETTLATISVQEAVAYLTKTRIATGAGGVLTRNPAVRHVHDMAERLAHLADPVVVLGPTGAGKELLANLLHARSERTGHFVAVNCGAIPADLAESELFGHVRGAFTGAVGERMGLLAQAHGGTLFLDEIGELPLNMQVKLLRALEANAVTPVGAARPVPASFRLVSATHRPLIDMVLKGTFREDLFYRIATHELVLPPLRERGRDDIELLFAHFWELTRQSGTKAGKPKLTAPALAKLGAYHWPGNVRQLSLVVRRLRFACGDNEIQVEDVSAALASFGALSPEPPATPLATGAMGAEAQGLLALLDHPLPLQNVTVEQLKGSASEFVQAHYLQRCAAIKADAEVGRQLGVTGRAVANWRKVK